MLSLYTNYIEAVREAIAQKPEQWTFKRDDRYREVLEHTPIEFARVMFEWSMKKMESLDLERVVELSRRNDNFGSPVQCILGPMGLYSPGNMRYLCHAIKVWRYLDSLKLPEVDIVEIGGGYGGLALWVRGLADLFRTHVDTYVMLDLPEVCTLQRMVAEHVGMDATAMDGTDPTVFAMFEHGTRPLVCLSAYAFSEFQQKTRDWYADKLLKHCQHGWMEWNFPLPLLDRNGVEFGGPVYPFVDKPIRQVPDEPALYEGHETVTW